ncbi:GSCOCT00014253001.2-RA-CDS [Cotesia congregata]|uniref:Cc_single_32.15 n=1 Tax=Cotesia congregata TaxID=51543 RepID=S6D4T4_COTCN|nr:GSCOCT00014253001.2-RA-CDS [Cotesia congregata]CAG5092521.1 cc_single_32.15 [Cotesia congregata]CCQ71243.1 hypothetical protein 32.15 [Cotesia congregata]
MAQRLLTAVASTLFKVTHDVFPTLTTALLQLYRCLPTTYLQLLFAMYVSSDTFTHSCTSLNCTTSVTHRKQIKFIAHHVIRLSKYGVENNCILTVTTILINVQTTLVLLKAYCAASYDVNTMNLVTKL